MNERILLIANETVDSDELYDALRARSAHVVVVVPALAGFGPERAPA